MNICIPVLHDSGLESPLCGHFGSAPLFILVDSERGTTMPIANLTHQNGHGNGGCRPLDSFVGHKVDALVVGGIGAGALNRLQAAGIPVFLGHHATVADVVAAHREGTLSLVTPEGACAGHSSGHGHSHGEGGCSGGHSHS